MSRRWDDGIEEKMSPEFRGRVMKQAQEELRKNTEQKRSWFWLPIAGLGLSALAATVLILREKPPRDLEADALAALNSEDFEMMDELELLDDLELLEAMSELDENQEG